MKDQPLANRIIASNYRGPSPFTYSQARNFPKFEVVNEFFPTSVYWSRFNHSNELLIGTRGSGKTILLKMLCYQFYKESVQITDYFVDAGRKYAGVYVPLRLQLLKEINENADEATQLKRFKFIFSCVVGGAFLQEIRAFLMDINEDETSKLIRTRKLINGIKKYWQIADEERFVDLDSIQRYIEVLFIKVRGDWALLDKERTVFAKGLLDPLLNTFEFVNECLSLNSDTFSWMVCFDEAEYLRPNLQAAINTLMRSESKGISIKIATLPLHWSNFETEEEGVFIQADGDDFEYISLDYSWETEDYKHLTNSLVVTRLNKTGLFSDADIDSTAALEDFLGRNADRELVSTYRFTVELPNYEPEKDLVQELLKRPGNNLSKSPDRGQIKRYAPIFLLRKLRALSKKGNTKVSWLAGAEMARRVSGGNIRRFIQICDSFFEKARKRRLTPNAQHETVREFASRFSKRANSVYREGFLLQDFLDKVANYLEQQMHEGTITDVGLEFTVSDEVLSENHLRRAICAGIAYSYIFCPEPDRFEGINSQTKLRLTNIFAAIHWLPMRAGTGVRVSSSSPLGAILADEGLLSLDSADKAIEALQLELFPDPKDELF